MRRRVRAGALALYPRARWSQQHLFRAGSCERGRRAGQALCVTSEYRLRPAWGRWGVNGGGAPLASQRPQPQPGPSAAPASAPRRTVAGNQYCTTERDSQLKPNPARQIVSRFPLTSHRASKRPAGPLPRSAPPRRPRLCSGVPPPRLQRVLCETRHLPTHAGPAHLRHARHLKLFHKRSRNSKPLYLLQSLKSSNLYIT